MYLLQNMHRQYSYNIAFMSMSLKSWDKGEV